MTFTPPGCWKRQRCKRWFCRSIASMRLKKRCGNIAGEIAAIILEPIPHNIGCVLPVPGFLEGLRDLSTIHGTGLIFDEVITGFRHGLGGYQKYAGVTPDLTTIAKSMANGYPVAALCGRADLMDRFQTNRGDVFFAGTYNGHPVGVAAALATIQKMEDGSVHERIFRFRYLLRRRVAGVFSIATASAAA